MMIDATRKRTPSSDRQARDLSGATGGDQPVADSASRTGNRTRIFSWIGASLLVAWAVWFAVCLRQQPMPRAVPVQHSYDGHRVTNILLEPMIGLDFHYNYKAARDWFTGQDPYALQNGPGGYGHYEYPPLTIMLFLWTNLVPPGPGMVWTRPDGTQIVFAPSKPAILLWIGAILAIVAFASWLTVRNRAVLGLASLPFMFVFGVALFSYPVLFEIERGNCNVLPMLAIAIGAVALSWRDRSMSDITAGLCTACAIGVKPYAVVLLPGLLTLRRWRAFAFALLSMAIEVAVFAPQMRAWLAIALKRDTTNYAVFEDWSHSVIGDWRLIWDTLRMPHLAALPAQACVMAILVVVCAIVGLKVYRRPTPAIVWPYLLWLTAVGTMLIPVAYDYNLIFLPFAVLAVWSARDSWWIQACVALVAVWCQPFYFGVTQLPLLALKSISILLVGAVIVRRLDRVAPAPLLPWQSAGTADPSLAAAAQPGP